MPWRYFFRTYIADKRAAKIVWTRFLRINRLPWLLKTLIEPRQQTSFGRNRVKRCGAVRLQVDSKFRWSARNSAAQQRRGTFACQVLPGLRGKGPVRKRSLSADLIFGYFLIKQKVKEPPRQLSGRITSFSTKHLLYQTTLLLRSANQRRAISSTCIPNMAYASRDCFVVPPSQWQKAKSRRDATHFPLCHPIIIKSPKTVRRLNFLHFRLSIM